VGPAKALERGRLTFVNTIWSGDMSNAARRLVVGGIDGTARLVDVDAFHLTGAPMKHDGVVVAATFARDGRWVVTRSEYAVRVWDGRLGYAVADEVRHSTRVVEARLVGAGRTLLTQGASDDVAPHILDLDFPLPQAAWLATLLEVVGGSRLDRSGSVTPMENSRGELVAVRRSVAEAPEPAWWSAWGERMLAKLGVDGGTTGETSR
jgi:hypothetical protein